MIFLTVSCAVISMKTRMSKSDTTRQQQENGIHDFVSSVPIVPGHQDEPRKKCTTPAKRGALYPRVVDLPCLPNGTDAPEKTQAHQRFGFFVQKSRW